MSKLLRICFVLVLFICIKATAQQKNVSGKVTDAVQGTGLPGVTVLEKGTNHGTTRDGHGKFSIALSNDNAILVFSFVGYEPKWEAVNGRTDITIALLPDIQTLGEVVVIGYGT